MSSSISEKFCLRWNEFEKNIGISFKNLRDDKDFFDVTLVCEDNQLQAHKVILSACSPFFHSILKKNPHHHPLLYLKGVQYNSLHSVLNFIYHGEVNIAQEDLNQFLIVAEDLKVKGLTQNEKQTQENPIQNKTDLKFKEITQNEKLIKENPIQNKLEFKAKGLTQNEKQTKEKPTQNKPDLKVKVMTQNKELIKTEPTQNKPVTSKSIYMLDEDNVNMVAKVKEEEVVISEHVEDDEIVTDNTVMEPEEVTEEQSVDIDNEQEQHTDSQEDHHVNEYSVQVVNAPTGVHVDFEEFVTQNITKDAITRDIRCLLCHKISPHMGAMKQHFEAQHFYRQYKCDECDKVFRTKNSFENHKKKQGH